MAWLWKKVYCCGFEKNDEIPIFNDNNQYIEENIEDGNVIIEEPRNIEGSQQPALRSLQIQNNNPESPSTKDSLDSDLVAKESISVNASLPEDSVDNYQLVSPAISERSWSIISSEENENSDNIIINDFSQNEFAKNQNGISKDDESAILNDNGSNVEAVRREQEYDEIYFNTFIDNITTNKTSIDDVSIKYLRRKHPDFLTKLGTNIIQKLYCQIALLKIRDVFDSKIILITDGTFDEKYFCDTQKTTLKLFSSNKINFRKLKIKEGKTKVRISASPNEFICTITDKTSNCLFLLPRGFNPEKQIDFTKKYTATMHPNSMQTDFALEGVKSITENDAMLKKLWIENGMEDGSGPNLKILKSNGRKGSGILKVFYGIIKNSKATLICAPTSDDVECITSKLLTAHPSLQNSIVRAITLKPQKSCNNPILNKVTKCITKIKDPENKMAIFCTLGVAPKFAKNGMQNTHFDNIIIDNAQSASELDCWMALGMLANANTKIYICGSLNDGKKVGTDVGILKCNKIGYRISMFERLCSFGAVKNQIEKTENIKKIVFKL